MNHKYSYCELCETPIIECGVCGNNSCNSGYGTVLEPIAEGVFKRVDCSACESTYQLARLQAAYSRAHDRGFGISRGRFIDGVWYSFKFLKFPFAGVSDDRFFVQKTVKEYCIMCKTDSDVRYMTGFNRKIERGHVNNETEGCMLLDIPNDMVLSVCTVCCYQHITEAQMERIYDENGI